MKKVKRELLIQQLEAVAPGLSAKDNVEQSSCYVFKDGKVMTFNDEIACSQGCDIGVEGAVHAQAFIEILRKLVEEEVDIESTEAELIISANRKKAGITRDAEVTLPIDGVEKPTKWIALHEEFLPAISMVQHCASSNDEHFKFTCVHIHPDYVEACDNTQMTRVTFPTGIKSDILVRRNSIKHITSLGMTKFCETDTWIHFKNPAGLVLSCRRFIDEYQDMTELLATKGEKLVLPKGIAEAADKAAVFCEENSDEGGLLFELKPGKLRLKGSGKAGWYREIKKIQYDGPELAFKIAPQLLIDITKRYNEAQISSGKLRVDMGTATYVSCLSAVEDEK